MADMRIIAGKHKGRKIELGKAEGVRPTSDFARQAIFNIVAHAEGEPLSGRAADLFCGSGAFGLEALSRGAMHVTFVDNAAQSLAAAHRNAEALGEADACDFLRADAARLPAASAPYDLLFLDPPYFSGLIGPCLNGVIAGGWAARNALVVVEHDMREEPGLSAQFHEMDSRRYGRACVRILRLKIS